MCTSHADNWLVETPYTIQVTWLATSYRGRVFCGECSGIPVPLLFWSCSVSTLATGGASVLLRSGKVTWKLQPWPWSGLNMNYPSVDLCRCSCLPRYIILLMWNNMATELIVPSEKDFIHWNSLAVHQKWKSWKCFKITKKKTDLIPLEPAGRIEMCIVYSRISVVLMFIIGG